MSAAIGTEGRVRGAGGRQWHPAMIDYCRAARQPASATPNPMRGNGRMPVSTVPIILRP
jgi:hypothetical protein